MNLSQFRFLYIKLYRSRYEMLCRVHVLLNLAFQVYLLTLKTCWNVSKVGSTFESRVFLWKLRIKNKEWYHSWIAFKTSVLLLHFWYFVIRCTTWNVHSTGKVRESSASQWKWVSSFLKKIGVNIFCSQWNRAVNIWLASRSRFSMTFFRIQLNLFSVLQKKNTPYLL